MIKLLFHFLLAIAGAGVTLSPLAFANGAAPLTSSEDRSLADAQQMQVENLIFPTLPEQFKINSSEDNNLIQHIGVRRDISTALSRLSLPLHFNKEENGTHSYSLHLVSPKAKALRIGLEITKLPDSAVLSFTTTTSKHAVTGADINQLINTNITADPSDRDARIYWSPTLPGESANLHITLPQGAAPSDLNINIPAISHLVLNPADLIYEAGSCYNDINCSSGWDSASSATAKMIVTGSGDTSMCTGTLLNDADTTTTTPYFVSANHCIPTQAIASSLETIWFHESSNCNSSSVSAKSVTISGGATLLWTKKMSYEANGDNMNISFMLLNQAPPEDAVYGSWSTSTTPLGLNSTIHQPGGDFKKISSGQRQGLYDCWMVSSTSFNCMPSNRGNFVRISWNTAGTQSGSCGAGLFQTDEHLTAVLTSSSGGNPCYTSFGYFSLFGKAYKEGDLGQWLDTVGVEPAIMTPLNYLLLKKKKKRPK